MRPVSIPRSTGSVLLEGALVLGIIATLIFGASIFTSGSPGDADSAFAAKGGKGNVTAAAWVAADPRAVAVAEAFTITGGGYDPAVTTYVLVKKPSSTTFSYATVDAAGQISFSAQVWETGRTVIEVYTLTGNGRSALVASTDVDVH